MTSKTSFYKAKIDFPLDVLVKKSEDSTDVEIYCGGHHRFAAQLFDGIDRSFIGYQYGSKIYQTLLPLLHDVVRDIFEDIVQEIFENDRDQLRVELTEEFPSKLEDGGFD